MSYPTCHKFWDQRSSEIWSLRDLYKYTCLLCVCVCMRVCGVVRFVFIILFLWQTEITSKGAQLTSLVPVLIHRRHKQPLTLSAPPLPTNTYITNTPPPTSDRPQNERLGCMYENSGHAWTCDAAVFVCVCVCAYPVMLTPNFPDWCDNIFTNLSNARAPHDRIRRGGCTTARRPRAL